MYITILFYFYTKAIVMIAYVNNQFVDEISATIGIGDLAVQRGYGIFDYFRTRHHFPLFIEDHLDRFFNSAKQLRLEPLQTREELKFIVHEMIRHNNIPDAGIRLTLTGGYSLDNFEPASSNLIVTQQPVWLPAAEKIQKGLQVITHEYMRDVPDAKSINYLMSIYLLDKMRAEHADEILYCDNNFILEFPRANVFIVTKEKKVVTPRVNVLKGITRKRIMELAKHSYHVEERNITIAELKGAAEVFLTSTTKRIIPVVTIDHQKVGDGEPGEITKNLLAQFVKMEEKIIAHAASKV